MDCISPVYCPFKVPTIHVSIHRFTIMYNHVFHKVVNLFPSLLVNDWAFPGCSFHTQSWYHLEPKNLCGKLPTGVFEEFQDFQSFAAPVPTCFRCAAGMKFRIQKTSLHCVNVKRKNDHIPFYLSFTVPQLLTQCRALCVHNFTFRFMLRVGVCPQSSGS